MSNSPAHLGRRSIIAIATFALFAMAAPEAQASLITYNFTATRILTNATSGLALTAAPFLTITGSFSYDTAVPASGSTPTTADYPTGSMAITEFNIASGNFLAPFRVFVTNDDPNDLFILATPGTSAAAPPGVYDIVHFELADTTDAALSSPALPTSLAGPWSSSFLTFFGVSKDMSGGYTGTGGQTQFRITTLAAVPTVVPEPSTLLLLGSGLAWGLRRRQRTKAPR